MAQGTMLSRKQFFRKYLWYFNLYGNLCFLGIALCGCGVFFSIRQAAIFWRADNKWLCGICVVLLLGLAAGFAACLTGGIDISRQFKEKFKFYRITTKRVIKNGFSDDFFADGFESPCYRLVIRQILADFGMQKEYRSLKRKLSCQIAVWENAGSA